METVRPWQLVVTEGHGLAMLKVELTGVQMGWMWSVRQKMVRDDS
jgi:hypothetical protein